MGIILNYIKTKMSRYPNHHYDYESESEDEYSEPKYTHQQQQH